MIVTDCRGEEVHDMLTVPVCATHLDGFVYLRFSLNMDQLDWHLQQIDQKLGISQRRNRRKFWKLEVGSFLKSGQWIPSIMQSCKEWYLDFSLISSAYLTTIRSNIRYHVHLISQWMSTVLLNNSLIWKKSSLTLLHCIWLVLELVLGESLDWIYRNIVSGERN